MKFQRRKKGRKEKKREEKRRKEKKREGKKRKEEKLERKTKKQILMLTEAIKLGRKSFLGLTLKRKTEKRGIM